MADQLEIVGLRIQRGVCEGRLSGGSGDMPALRFEAGEIVWPAPRLTRDETGWLFTQDLPAALLNDGAQAVVIVDAASGQPIGQFALSVGEALAEDLRAQVAQLRAELDLLKTAFRREMRRAE